MLTRIVDSRKNVANALRTFTTAIGFSAIAFAAALAASAEGAFPNGEPKAVSVDELKKAYLSCSRAAMEGQLTSSDIWQCSMVYEALKIRAFGGDFEELRAWSKTQPDGERPRDRSY